MKRKTCCKPLASSHHGIHCNNCNIWLMLTAAVLTYKDMFLQKSSAARYCTIYSGEICSGKKHKVQSYHQKNSEQNIDLMDKLNKAMDDPDFEMMTAKYYEPDKVSFVLLGTYPNKYFFHINIFPCLSTLMS